MDNYIIRKVSDNDPKKYNFYTIDNIQITDKKLLLKLSKIYISPAYKDVKIFLDKNILATGINSAGRKQYVYSESSKNKRELKKYCQLIMLSNNILKLKKKINDDLSLKKYSKNKIIALILKIMDLCNFRCGNKKYEEKYGSYGLTTLYKKHVKFHKDSVEIDFIGKKSVVNNCIILDENINEMIKTMYKLSTKADDYLFSTPKIKISINDINKYLKKYNITTKDLRTWNANIIFLKNFRNELIDNKAILKLSVKKKLIREAIKKTAISLHHTPHICKNSYIYKNILEKIEKNDKIIDKLLNKNSIIEDILKDLLKNKNSKKCNNL